ncbi:MAG: hypothetical protein KME23_12950 [Goleter apudmare HA4340-LM2]|jgi:hypothetical protein|nr:hypothetical protein [Goleter apudmare HA4340-LM2]
MLQIIDLQINELYTEVSSKESATVIGGQTTNGMNGLNLMNMLPLLLMFTLFSTMSSNPVASTTSSNTGLDNGNTTV